ncbi:MAG: hypothetical protein P8X55_09790 [Desulfosarcinaceae bacterium]
MKTSPSNICRNTDACVPGGVYLCQVSDTVSCGACCGLFNVHNLSRVALAERLKHRSRAFARIPRTVEAIGDFAEAVRQREDREPPLADFHHCPFVGLIGDGLTRVGCLLHPLGQGNQGVDYRGLSYYGGMACRSYFCPTFHALAPRHKRIIRALAADWFDYGLIVTEHRLLAALFEQLEDGLGHPVDESMFPPGSGPAAEMRSLLALKLAWPFRPDGAGGLCHYFFKDDLYPRPGPDYRRLNRSQSPLGTILTELGSVIENPARLRDAEALVAGRIQAVIAALAG